ncbi:hypothetical protein [Pelagibius sp.]|uniref:hypothetical protein n=1 Tax=Pelagibius sp. TaxID=1931238 RepID=UPI003B502C31
MSDRSLRAEPASPRPFAQAHRLITKDGGGVVFPRGFHGPGFHLPEWEFIRYCARADHEVPQPEAESWWQRHMAKPSFFMIFLWVLATPLIDWVVERAIAPSALTAALMLYISFTFYREVVRSFHAEPKAFLHHYPSARKLSLFSHWWPHIRAAMVMSRETGLWGLVWKSLAFGILGYLLYMVVRADKLNPIIGVTLAPPVLVMAVYPLILMGSVLLVYLRLRRRPTPEDLQPVEAAPLRAD